MSEIDPSLPLRNAQHELFCQMEVQRADNESIKKACGYKVIEFAIFKVQLKNKPLVRARLDYLHEQQTQSIVSVHKEQMDQVLKDLAISKKWVLQELIEAVQMGKSAIPVLDGKGNPTGEYKQNLPASIRALELIGKELQMFRELPVEPEQALIDLTIDELNERIAKNEQHIRSLEQIAGTQNRTVKVTGS